MRFRGGPKFHAKRTPDSEGVMHRSASEPRFVIKIAPQCAHCAAHGVPVCIVEADASFIDETGRARVRDYKGIEGDTPIFRLKQKLAAIVLGIEIEMVGPAKARKLRKAEAAAMRREIKKRERREAKAAASQLDTSRTNERAASAANADGSSKVVLG